MTSVDLVTTAPDVLATTVVDLVVPTYNEAAAIDRNVRRLHAHLSATAPFHWRITIADNGSTDDTLALARQVAAELPAIAVVSIPEAGRGGALRAAWSASDADIVAYTDVDLSTDLDALVELIRPLARGEADIAIGSRLAKGARVKRGLKRELVSRVYNALLHLALDTEVHDAQCGFKALRADAARELLPVVEDDKWFFDTELLVAAQRRGMRIIEVPVEWVDDPDSRVKIVPTAIEDLRGVWRVKRGDDPRWVRPALFALLAITAGLYLWGLGRSGWGNDFYSAAVQAGSKSWKAFFFGSSDSSNFITVDKTPLFLWPMDLAARFFGVNAWSILVPQALEGVLTVAVLYAAVKRWFGPVAGLLAGAVVATTPVAALMFRFNNPDAMLVLLLTIAAYCTVRAVERGSTRWVVATGAFVGLAFLAKELQAFLVVPGFALVFLVAAPVDLWTRVRRLLLAGVAMVVAFGWWMAIVALWPASSRPYIGGSQNNSIFNVIFGYNGFGRLTGNERGSVGGGPAGQTGRWGPTGLTRLFNSQFGGEVSWLIPAALVLLVGLLIAAGVRSRTDRVRAGALLWGSWLLVTGLAISLGQGIIHPYYTVALAPGIGGLVGAGTVTLWRLRHLVLARIGLAASLLAAAWWADRLLARTPNWHRGLGGLLLGTALACAVALVIPWRQATAALAIGAVGLLVAFAGPVTYTWATVMTPHSGAIPSSGPPGAARGFGGPGGGGPRFGQFGGRGNGNFTFPGGGVFPNQGGGQPFPRPQFGGGFGSAPRGGGGIGGILGGSRPTTELTNVLKAGAKGYRWAAAAVASNQAAGYQLASGEPVMAIGGFNGTDPAPSLAQFQAWVAAHKIHYFIGGGRGGGFRGGFGGGGSGTSAQISAWVEANFPSTTVGGVTLYDLSGGGS